MKTTFSPAQVARAIGVSESSLKRWCDRGIIPSRRTAGGHRRVEAHEVIRFARERGMPLRRPEELGLLSSRRGERQLDEVVVAVEGALMRGDENVVRAALVSLYAGGHELAEVCDRVLARALGILGERWRRGELSIYQERRACQIAVAALQQLGQLIPPPAAEAPRALGGTLTHDRFTVPIAMVEVVLREAGWNAASLGVGHPAQSLCQAVRAERPRLLWLSLSHIPDEEAFLGDYQLIASAARDVGAALIIGGRALAEPLRRRLRYSAYGDNLAHLLGFAMSLWQPPPKSNTPARGDALASAEDAGELPHVSAAS